MTPFYYRASSCRGSLKNFLLSTIGGRKCGNVFQYHSWRETPVGDSPPRIGTSSARTMCWSRGRGETDASSKNGKIALFNARERSESHYPAAATVGLGGATLTASLP